GLTVVQKIVQDHGGRVLMERTEDARTIFRITIPGRSPQGSAQDKDEESDDQLTARPLASLNNDRANRSSD
ncbi:MAG TPA: ATP-binding protein, partial [Candidatus Acidoferrales bacterium]|nr:ATP-binding protein [Candidatus Acidoferrales bacterium]